MLPFNRLDAIAAPLPFTNVDTDKILPGRFLKTVTREGLGEKLFWALRRDSNFVLNRKPWNKARILVALDNFGCGSSREHAPWALLDFGIRSVVAPSIADIFYNNCFKNGILPITLPETVVRRLISVVSEPSTARMTIDLEAQTVTMAGAPPIIFEIDSRRKEDLLSGADEIARSLGQQMQITAYEAVQRTQRPWVTDMDQALL